jgi:hypothetical protein
MNDMHDGTLSEAKQYILITRLYRPANLWGSPILSCATHFTESTLTKLPLCWYMGTFAGTFLLEMTNLERLS